MEAFLQVVASSLPEAPPKETRTLLPDDFSAEILDFTAGWSMAFAPHVGVQPPRPAITKARLKADAEPADSLPEAAVALTYGTNAGLGKGLSGGDCDGVSGEVSVEGTGVLGSVGAACEGDGSEEHPVQVSAVAKTSPAAGLRRLLIAHPPLL
ncbi:hypothetical protein GCM10010307_38790 [Streptomyces vastus]|uniref:Uncharacterized protein n=1 Tax=Streptomyces vastus TaxID=285451 RepID=A0ABN3R0C6_9ACTN